MTNEEKQAKILELSNGYTKEQLYQMYVVENYSMELVANVTKINMATLSRLLWYYNLPNIKREYYGSKQFTNEVTSLKQDKTISLAKIDADEDFFKEL